MGDSSGRAGSGGGRRTSAANSDAGAFHEMGQSGFVAGATGPKESLPRDIGFLLAFGFSAQELTLCAKAAKDKAIPAHEILIARNLINRDRYFRLLAFSLGAAHQCEIDADNLLIPNLTGPLDIAMWSLPTSGFINYGGGRKVVTAPRPSDVSRLLEMSRRHSKTLHNLVIVPAPALRDAFFRRMQGQVEQQARYFLATRHPSFSARTRVIGSQKLALCLALLGCVISATLAPLPFVLFATVFFAFVYLICVLFRFVLIARLDRMGPSSPGPRDPVLADEDVPIYSVLVPLYDEANQVRPLIAALDAMQWPRSKRDVLLITEADDAATLAALRANRLPEGFRVVVCPHSLPKTKPKALNFAVPLAIGEFIVIYDAEDRPHPGQLIEAWTQFRNGGPDLACLQAPLVANRHDGRWISAMFEIEYATLFQGTLPVLKGLTDLLPLGGTSNHFRADMLKAVGAWDPFNVTEDADLGIRIARCGHRAEVITLPTFEEAPLTRKIWFGQRCRWLKGWLQTVLVHLRNPNRLHADLGWRNALFFHLFFTTHLISILFHPLFLALAGYQFWILARGQIVSAWGLALLGVSVFTLAGGYTSYGFLALAVRSRLRVNQPSNWILLSLPFYWLFISAAGWKALWELFRRPFHWEKTQHGLAKTPENANNR